MKHLVVFLLVMAGAIPAIAQNRDSFESFRENIKSNFDAFRNKILNDYDKFLDGIWTEYDAFRGKERNTIPKPPKAPENKNVPEQQIARHPIVPDTLLDVPLPQRKTEKPEPVMDPADLAEEWETFKFYCITVKIPKLDFSGNSDVLCSQNFAELWRIYTNNKLAQKMIPALKRCAASCNLNDWFILELIQSYVNNLFPTAEQRIRISLMHYLLSHWGYDVRIGVDDSENPFLLIAVQQMIYARTYADIDGQRYYFLYDSQSQVNQNRNYSFKTCDLPKNADKGYVFNLIISEDLNIPYRPHHYAFNYKNLKIEGDVNANLMPMLYHYPQMDISGYVCSNVNETVRQDVVEQLRLQLADMPQQGAVDSLLQFVQSAFEYATDDEQHGFEKPYFFEETLFYPQCDCEDRSIFYSYLLWYALGVENQLISYPGHEAVAVHLDTPINGDGYLNRSKHFYISDPTYIGSKTGMCIPDYRYEQPKVDFYYQHQQ